MKVKSMDEIQKKYVAYFKAFYAIMCTILNFLFIPKPDITYHKKIDFLKFLLLKYHIKIILFLLMVSAVIFILISSCIFSYNLANCFVLIPAYYITTR